MDTDDTAPVRSAVDTMATLVETGAVLSILGGEGMLGGVMGVMGLAAEVMAFDAMGQAIHAGFAQNTPQQQPQAQMAMNNPNTPPGPKMGNSF